MIAILGLSFGPVAAQEICPAFSPLTGATVPSTPRLVRDQLGGVPYNVLLPTGYAESSARYPVLYLFNSLIENENEYLALTDLVEFTEGEPVIVVLPYGGTSGWYSDWIDGSQKWETFHIDALIPHIDATLRTIADRGHRAVAGFSMGGFGAMTYAARHPALFSVAGSFSGVVDTLTLRGRAAIGLLQGPCDMRPPFAVWGDPVTNEAEWRAHNPTDLAANLDATSVYLAARTGLPCQDDPLPDPLIEPMVREMTENMSRALSDNGIAHALFLEPCGGHYYNYVQRDIHRFWLQMREGFASAD
jgi:S-formylglutathione hydrolase FrmB